MRPTRQRIDGGYILLARRTLSSGIMEKPPLHLKLWIWILLQASHKNHHGLARGQLRTSLEKMRRAIGHKSGYRSEYPSKKQVRIALEILAKSGMIETTKVTHGMLITICNYDEYQSPENYGGHDLTHGEPSRGTMVGTVEDTGPPPENFQNDRLFSDTSTHGGHSGGHNGKPGKGTMYTRREIQEEKIAENTSKRPRPAKKTNPEIRKFLSWWDSEYLQVNGIKYHFTGSKEAPIIQKLLKTYTLAHLTAMATAFLRSDDPFIQHTGYTIGVFGSQANKLAAAVGPEPELRVIPSDQVLEEERNVS